jgi:acetate kinase
MTGRNAMQTKVLVINSGSSSIKFELHLMPEKEVLAKGLLQKIGEDTSDLKWKISGQEHVIAKRVADHDEGLRLIMAAITDRTKGGLKDLSEIGAVGHRVVHGGEAFSDSVLITDEVERAIEEHVELAPLHNPPNLLGIRVARKLLPKVPQVAVFDTSFHQTIPEVAFTYAVPYEWYKENKVRRYGFHGTSHRYVAARAAKMLGRPEAELDLITAHLGNGCSITAIRRGKSVDTSMGLTPLEGLVMGTRSGDIDPAIVAHMDRVRKLGVAQIDNLLNKKSGLLGLSGVSNDLRAVLKAEAEGNARAKLALDVYCYRVKKYIGSYTAVLGRPAAVVFTAGVGENAAPIRARILEGLDGIGYRMDAAKNKEAVGKEMDISTPDSPSRILVVPTNEELLIALDTYAIATANASHL